MSEDQIEENVKDFFLNIWYERGDAGMDEQTFIVEKMDGTEVEVQFSPDDYFDSNEINRINKNISKGE